MVVSAASDPSDLARVAPALARYAVHIGWTFSGDDFSTPYNPQAVINNYLPFANQGQTGIILMHSVYNATALALPSLIENAKMVSETCTDEPLCWTQLLCPKMKRLQVQLHLADRAEDSHSISM